MMTQTVLPFHYSEATLGKETANAGLPLYFELSAVSGIVGKIAHHLQLRKAGWEDVSIVIALVLLNVAGGTHVEDIECLEADTGLRQLMFAARDAHLSRGERRRKKRERRKAERRGEAERAFPSPSSIRRYLERFHDPETDRLREEALACGRKAFIVPETEAQRALWLVVKAQLGFLFRHESAQSATLDMDATCVETHKSTALPCYKGYRAYQPVNVYWYEQGTIAYSEFRDGNVPAAYALLGVLERALEQLPEGVERVMLRSDSAGYCWELLRFCAEGYNQRFGVIDFAVSADVTPEFKKAVALVPTQEWKPLFREDSEQTIDTTQEFAEVVYVPNAIGHKKVGPNYRFIAIREPLAQLQLPSLLQESQQELPFPTMQMLPKKGPAVPHKLHAVVTNLDWPAQKVISWLRQRCGKSEEVHAIMKHDLAGGTLPSNLFGANAAWWTIMIIAHNLNTTMKHLVLGDRWVRRRMKAIRFHFVHIAGRIVGTGRRLLVRIAEPAHTFLQEARMRILALANAPPI